MFTVAIVIALVFAMALLAIAASDFTNASHHNRKGL